MLNECFVCFFFVYEGTWPDEIRCGRSQVPTIKVIKSYHYLYVDINMNLREFSRHNPMCIETNHQYCTRDMYCGDWVPNQMTKPYPSYDQMHLLDSDNDDQMIDHDQNR